MDEPRSGPKFPSKVAQERVVGSWMDFNFESSILRPGGWARGGDGEDLGESLKEKILGSIPDWLQRTVVLPVKVANLKFGTSGGGYSYGSSGKRSWQAGPVEPTPKQAFWFFLGAYNALIWSVSKLEVVDSVSKLEEAGAAPNPKPIIDVPVWVPDTLRRQLGFSVPEMWTGEDFFK